MDNSPDSLDSPSSLARTPSDEEAYSAQLAQATAVDVVDRLKFFLAVAPSQFDSAQTDEDRRVRRFELPAGGSVACVQWRGFHYITGTDIVRALTFRFLAFGRPVRNVKKFEEGIFSDLRNLKHGVDATLEDAKSDFLEYLFECGCVRTQKKQKVFHWFSVPHDRLFLDALDRDLKRERLGLQATTEAVQEPALSFQWDPKRSLYEQFASASAAAGHHQLFPASAGPSAATPAADQDERDVHSLRSGPAVVPTSAEVMGSRALIHGSSLYKKPRGLNSRRKRARSTSDFEESMPPGKIGAGSRTRTTSTRPAVRRQVKRESSLSSHSDVESARAVASRQEGSGSRVPAAPEREPEQSDEEQRTSNDSRAGSPTPLSCPLYSCSRTFSKPEHLQQHMRTHSVDRLHACPSCGGKFLRAENLAAHLATSSCVTDPSSYADVKCEVPPDSSTTFAAEQVQVHSAPQPAPAYRPEDAWAALRYYAPVGSYSSSQPRPFPGMFASWWS